MIASHRIFPEALLAVQLAPLVEAHYQLVEGHRLGNLLGRVGPVDLQRRALGLWPACGGWRHNTSRPLCSRTPKRGADHLNVAAVDLGRSHFLGDLLLTGWGGSGLH